MEFRFDVNNLLVNEIVRVDNTLILPQWRSSTRNRLEYQQLYEIINAIGEASAFAQSLNRIITTSDKLQNSDHILYLMKEVEKERTVVVGMLKVGRKKLFVLSPSGATKEVAPLCVLDFYIHESRQRRGYGKKLFDYMLRDQNLAAGHMAVDKPSDKFVLFLQRHYGLSAQVAQINNFVVYADFFVDRPVSSDEAVMTHVSRSNRSSRGGSPSAGASPALSPSASRRGSSAFGPPNPASPAQYAGKPSRSRETNMSDILHGRADRHTVGARMMMTTPRHQNTLDWMRGPRGASSGGDSPYYSRTPSYSGTPREASPLASGPPTPPRGRFAHPTTAAASASAVARKLVIEQDKLDG